MINLPLLLEFVAAASVLTITPGVDTAMVLRSATVDGRRSAVLAAFGIQCGCLVWGLSVAFGLGALLRASELAYTILKVAGAMYLLWLGVRLIISPREALEGTEETNRSGGTFWRGFLTNILNPKVGVFYVTFLPQFVPVAAGVARYTMFLVSIHVVLGMLWFALLIAATMPLGRFLRRPGAVCVLDRLMWTAV
ncbi:LysE family translocator [Acetobacter oryzifermentans]|uniref:Lysine transporter LysE n=1 Tax=Acetobacter oryzifermentans TaxID=1633874 RepID=A0ABM6AN67_9PROT|nr:LysE family translocator [Acetobacter oryzifermentans]ANA15313.1 lysine transporter LysE [Acetobacter oryzifermentans]